MPREYNISWNKAQLRKLNSAVRKYNNAIRRAVKANPLAKEFLPEEVKYQDVKAGITTRRALNNVVNRLSRINRKGALDLIRQDDGSVVTKYERHEFNVLKSVRERKKSMQAKRIAARKMDIGQKNPVFESFFKPDKRKASKLSAKGLRRFIETQERRMNMSNVEAVRRYFNNYVNAMLSVFGGFADYDNQLEKIQEKILELAGEDFDKLQDTIEDAPPITYIYDPIARDAKMQRIFEYWESV